MFGVLLAFKRINLSKGFIQSIFSLDNWVGFKNFTFYFNSQDAFRTTKNTLFMNALFIVIGLVVSLCFALFLNEIKKRTLIKFYQTTMFFPYFISWVLAGFMLYSFLSSEKGILNNWFSDLGLARVDWYSDYKYWPFILLIMYIWKSAGYSTLIYYSSILGIGSEYYEAAEIDGASKLQTVFKITLPLLSPVIILMVILQIGRVFYADFGLFYNLPRNIGLLYPATDVIDTYVYRSLRVTGELGLASAAGFYQSIVGFALVLGTNLIVRKKSPENAIF
jgi:ABC-type polysaccharide transport system, permease component